MAHRRLSFIWLTSCRNNELQFAGVYGEHGVRYTLTLPEGDEEARSRQVRQPAVHASGSTAQAMP